MNVLTIAAVIVILFCAFRGWKRGIVMWIYGVAAWIFIMLFVMVAHNILYTAFMENEQIYGKAYEAVYPYVNKYIPESKVDNINLGDAAAKVDELLPDGMAIDGNAFSGVDADTLREFGVDVPNEYEGIFNNVMEKISKSADAVGDVKESLTEGVSKGTSTIRETTVAAATETVVEYILRALAVFASYLIAKIICVIIKIILTVVTENALIRTPVHIAGAALGLLEGVLYIWIVLYGIRVLSVTDIGSVMAAEVRSSVLLSALDQNNMLAGFLGNLFGI